MGKAQGGGAETGELRETYGNKLRFHAHQQCWTDWEKVTDTPSATGRESSHQMEKKFSCSHECHLWSGNGGGVGEGGGGVWKSEPGFLYEEDY